MRHNLMKSIALLLILATQAQAVTTSPDPLHQACSLSACLAADLTCDGKVDAGDALIIRSPGTWETSGAPGFVRADLNHDGLVNSGDLLMVRAPGTWKAETGPCSCDACGSNSAPVAMVEATPLESSGRIFEFDGSSSSDADGEITSYQWNLGDSTVASGSSVTHTYAQPGTYTVSLSVADSCGATGSTTIQVNYIPVDCGRNIPPTAVIGVERDVLQGDSILFSGSGSFDLDGAIVQWHWDLGDGSVQDDASFAHTYTAVGDHVVRLLVEDTCGETAEVYHHLRVHPPFDRITHDFPLEIGRSIQFQSTVQAAVNDYYYWQFGDGSFTFARTPSYSYANTGTFVVSVTVYDAATWQIRDYAERTVVIEAGLTSLGSVGGTWGTISGLALVDGRAWVASVESHEVAVVDGLATQPFLLAQQVVADEVRDVAAGAGLVAVSAGWKGVYVYASPPVGSLISSDGSGPLEPIYHLDTGLTFGRTAQAVLFHGRTMYVACDLGLLVVDVSAPNPDDWQVHQFDCGPANGKMVTAYGWLYVATYGPFGLRVINIYEPLAPVDAGFLPLTSLSPDLSVAYAGDSARLGVVEVMPTGSTATFYQVSRSSSSGVPQYLSRVYADSNFKSIALAGNAAYVAESRLVRRYDLSTVSSPVYDSQCSVNNSIGSLEIGADDRLYVGRAGAALQILTR